MSQRQPFHGELNIGTYSSLRKIMRAARRNRLPAEILLAIENGSGEKALLRHSWYRRKKEWDALRALVNGSAA